MSITVLPICHSRVLSLKLALSLRDNCESDIAVQGTGRSRKGPISQIPPVLRE